MKAPTRNGALTLVLALALIALHVTLAVALSGCASQQPAAEPPAESATPVELNVSAATTLKSAFEELAPAFEEANGVTLVYNFGASGVLQKQIEGGAAAEVFVSASPAQVDTLTAGGFVSAEDTSTFISNRLVIAVPRGNPAAIAGPDDLTKADRVAIGNPETAPAGTKAKEWMTSRGVWAGIEPKCVFGENAAQVTDYVARGEVDAAVMFASEATGREDVEVVYAVPASETTPIKYVAAPLRDSAHFDAAVAFVEFLTTPEAQKVLIANGFVAYEPK